jgi:site-specific recombinase XerD
LTSPVTTPGYHSGRTAPNKGRSFPAEVLTPDEVKALIRACSNRAPTGIRNRALIVVMYRGGLRLGEALALKPKDIDPDQGTITVLHGKGDRRRIVGVDPGAMAILLRWIEKRRTLGLTGRQRCTSR